MINPALPTPISLSLERLPDYVPGSCTDDRKLGVAVGSGGGAGAVSLGSLVKLQEIGVLHGVDGFYGVSVGAINIATFATGQYDTALAGYRAMTENGFVKRSRVHRIMDMGLLRRVLNNGADGLDIDKLTQFPAPVTVGVTRLSGGISPVKFDLTEIDPEAIVDVLLWGASIPGATGLSPRDSKGLCGTRNAAYADGGFSVLSAVDMAANDGCTDIIYLPNQPYAPESRTAWQVALFGALMTPYDSSAIRIFSNTVNKQVASRQVFQDGVFQYGDATVAAYYPPADPETVSQLPKLFNMDPKKIITGFNIAQTHILERLMGINGSAATIPAAI